MELNPLVLVLGVEFLHLRHLIDAGYAPGRPEIDDHDFTPEAHRDLGTFGGIGELQLERLAQTLASWER